MLTEISALARRKRKAPRRHAVADLRRTSGLGVDQPLRIESTHDPRAVSAFSAVRSSDVSAMNERRPGQLFGAERILECDRGYRLGQMRDRPSFLTSPDIFLHAVTGQCD